jgi:hypothetical protein
LMIASEKPGKFVSNPARCPGDKNGRHASILPRSCSRGRIRPQAHTRSISWKVKGGLITIPAVGNTHLRFGIGQADECVRRHTGFGQFRFWEFF